MKFLFALLLTFLFIPSSWSLELVLLSKGLSKGEQAKAAKLINEVMAVLPSSMKDDLQLTVPVTFTDIDKKKNFKIRCMESNDNNYEGNTFGLMEQNKFGQYKYRIKIHVGFLAEEFETPITCKHRTVGKIALASVIHELAHIYDLENIRDEEVRKWADNCQSKDLAPKGRNMPAGCTHYRDYLVTFSKDPRFKALSYWTDGILINKQTNVLRARSPDLYEYSDPRESVAINFEYFFLDEEFGCRRPGMYAYLSEKLNHFPFPDRDCQATTEIEMISNDKAKLTSTKVDLDPSRIYQIHYLLAGKGEKIMSRWGHAMFKIIVCSPERKRIGPECLQDKIHHVVAGFRAKTDGEISQIKGVLGGYPSQLFIQSYLDTYDEYARRGLRDLYSVPLHLKSKEKELFVWQILETYWSYQGKYAFFTNNCADEAIKLLKRISNNRNLLYSETITPLGLFDVLFKAGLIKDENIEVPSIKTPSEKEILQKSFLAFAPYYEAFINRRELTEAQFSGPYSQKLLDKYLRKSSAKERRELYDQIMKIPASSSQTIAGFLIIEENFIFPMAATRLINYVENARKKYIELRKMTPLNIETAAMPNSGYGIPLHNEDPEFSQNLEKANHQIAKWNNENQEFIENLQEEIQPIINELELIQNNIKKMMSDYKRNRKNLRS